MSDGRGGPILVTGMPRTATPWSATALLWRVIYGTVAGYRAEIPGLEVVRHEDLSGDPVPAGGVSKTAARRLDSRANLRASRERLGPEEVARVRQQTADVAQQFGYT